RVTLPCCPSGAGGFMNRRFIPGIGILAACAFLVTTPTPAAAQAKGSADAGAAKRLNPHWKAPRTARGHPDLEGIWTPDDMRGIPMSRQKAFGNRIYMTDEEFAN